MFKNIKIKNTTSRLLMVSVGAYVYENIKTFLRIYEKI